MTIEQLYIRENERPDGPYDMMAVIRKIRNGTINEETLVSYYPDEEPAPASALPDVLALIAEEKQILGQPVAAVVAPVAGRSNGGRPQKNFFKLLMGPGLDFLRNSMNAAIYSGVFIVIWLVLGAWLIYGGSVLSSLIGIILCYFLMGGYLFGVLRYVRGNPVNPTEVIRQMKATLPHMGILSVIVGMLMLPGLVLVLKVLTGDNIIFSLPIVFLILFVVMTFFAFAPLLIVDRGMDFWDAITASSKIVRSNNNIGIVFGLIAVNFILFFLMPIIFPMTMGVLVELYDEYVTYG